MDAPTWALCVLLSVILGPILFRISSSGRRKKRVGPSVFFPSLRSIFHARKLLEEGSQKFPESLFVMPLFPFGPTTVVTGAKLIDELRRVPDSTFSFFGALQRLLQFNYTIGPEIAASRHHVTILGSRLTRSLEKVVYDLADELPLAFEDAIALKGHEWKTIDAMEVLSRVVSRISGRALVGLPFCRLDSYRNICVAFSADVIRVGSIINIFPSIMHPLVGSLISRRKQHRRKMAGLLEIEILNRQKRWASEGDDWKDRPEDYLMWLIEEAPVGERTPLLLAQRILQMVFAAVHTTSMSIVHATYHLAAQPHDVDSLRAEASLAVQEHGWTKLALGKMTRIDSFLRESSRLNSISLLSLLRKAETDYTFSDGTHVQAGSYVMASSYSTHMDPSRYDQPENFRGDRFLEFVTETGHNPRHMAAPSIDYLPFGLGKHTCPGRFFAAAQLKALVAYLILNYDIGFEDGGTRPPNDHMGPLVAPNRSKRLRIRKRCGSTGG